MYKGQVLVSCGSYVSDFFFLGVSAGCLATLLHPAKKILSKDVKSKDGGRWLLLPFDRARLAVSPCLQSLS